MASIRTGLPEPDGKIGDTPVERFVTDFRRLITDVDRLMTDIGRINHGEGSGRAQNGGRHNVTLDETISSLQGHARSFVKSVRRNGVFHERIPVPYLELDGKARILASNQECGLALDPAGKPVIGKSLFSFISSTDAHRLREHLAVCRRSDKVSSLAVTLVRKGARLPVELHLRRKAVGNETGFLAVMLDSSNHFVAQSGNPSGSLHELLVKLSRAHTLMSVVQIVAAYCRRVLASQAGMIFMERDGKLLAVSQWNSNQVPKRFPSEEEVRNGRVTHAFRTGVPVFWSQAKSRLEISNYLRRLLPGHRWRSAAFLPISSAGGQPCGVLALFFLHEREWLPETRDEVSRLGQLVSGSMIRARGFDEALAARAMAERTRQRHEGYLSVVCHELKNPMMPILNWAVALSSGTLPADKQSVAIESIIRNVRAMNYLIDDLFDLARISAGKLHLEFVEMRIQDVVREALTATQQTAERKKLRIATDIAEAIPRFMADPRRVRQVLINLLANAVKFTPGEGSISLKVARRGDHVECTISDTGQGIDPDFLPLVFDRFQQENRAAKSKGAGLGLGLAIVREIVELHGGTVKAHSRGADHGATFSFRLPMRKHKYSAA